MIPLKLTVLACCLFISVETVQVDTPLGTVEGDVTENEYEGASCSEYKSFKGLRYAKVLTEETKFLPPLEPEPWEGVYDATEFCENCLGLNPISQSVEGDLECLCLNVYTPNLPSEQEECKPVMVFIHGGGFVTGSGDDDMYGPQFLIRDCDVLIVTINYRLAILGFLNGKTKSIPGNVGLKDQVAALQWVKKYIQYFGGCPDRVTIFGESAGAASVTYQLISNMSEGLFQQAISQSGQPTDVWAFTDEEDKAFFSLAKSLGIESEDREEIAKELTKISAQELMEVFGEEILESTNQMDLFKYAPSREIPIEGHESFLLETPFQAIANGRMKHVPLIVGVTSDEGGVFAPAVLEEIRESGNTSKTFISDLLPNFWKKLIPPEDIDTFDDTLIKMYTGGSSLKDFDIKSLTKFMSDFTFHAQYTMVTQILSHYGYDKIYKYLLEYRSSTGGFKEWLEIENACIHTDDLFMMFSSDLLYNIPEPGSPEEDIMLVMTQLWKNFAITSNPTPVLDDVTPVEWLEMGKENNIFFIRNDGMSVEQKFCDDKLQFWVQLMKPLYGELEHLFDETE